MLALCVTTIMITLVVFIVFKVRQGLSGTNITDKIFLDGVFFRRYSPKLEAINEEYKKKIAKRMKPMDPRKKLILIFAGTFTFVLSMISFESFYVHRRQIEQRIVKAQEIQKMIEKGMLRKYSYNLAEEFQALNEFIPKNSKAIYLNTISRLKQYDFIMLDSLLSQTFGKKDYFTSFERWKKFLEKSNLKFKIQNNLPSSLEDNQVLILPNTISLTMKERQILDKLIDVNSKIILEGRIGHLNKNGGQNMDGDYIQRFDIFISKNTSKSFPNTQLNSILQDSFLPLFSPFFWPDRNDFDYFSPNENIYLYASNSTNQINRDELGREQIKAKKVRKNVLWLSNPPFSETESESENDILINNYLVSKMILDSFGHPFVKLARWPEGKKIALVNYFVANTNLDDIRYILSYYNQYNMPLTIFLNTNKYSEDDIREFYNNYPNEYSLYLELDFSQLKYRKTNLFEQIQSERIRLERLTASKVAGVFFSDFIPNTDTYNIFAQNRLEYIYASNFFNRLSPYYLNHGKNMFYSKYFEADDEIFSENVITTVKSFEDYLTKHIENLKQYEGIYTLGIRNQSLAKRYNRPFLNIIKDLYEEDKTIWMTSFSDLSDWVNLRNSISIIENDKKVTIKNQNDTQVSKIMLKVQNAAFDKESTDIERAILAIKGEKENEFLIENLNPGQEITLNLK